MEIRIDRLRSAGITDAFARTEEAIKWFLRLVWHHHKHPQQNPFKQKQENWRKIMSEKTKIQWCDSTVNPTMGCNGCELWKPVQGVRRCYAGVLHERFGKNNRGYAPTFEKVTFFPGRMEQVARKKDLRGSERKGKPWLNGHPRMIFVSDMSDALSREVPFGYLREEIIDKATSAAGRRHVWLWLSKRPGRMAKFSRWLEGREVSWPQNIWPGTSITTMGTTGRIDDLLQVGDSTTRRFLSVEPQWEEIHISKWSNGLHWIVQGGESGAQAKPFDLRWARILRDECAAMGAAFFLKQLGQRPVDATGRIRLADTHGGDWTEWPEDLRVRQFPPPRPFSEEDRPDSALVESLAC